MVIAEDVETGTRAEELGPDRPPQAAQESSRSHFEQARVCIERASKPQSTKPGHSEVTAQAAQRTFVFQPAGITEPATAYRSEWRANRRC